MKIAIPVENQSLASSVCASFGRTPYFLMYDTETKTAVFLENAAATSTGGAGILAAQAVVDQKADVLLTPRCGQNAADVIEAAEVKIFKTTAASAMENISAYLEGKLSLLAEFHAGFHGHGGN